MLNESCTGRRGLGTHFLLHLQSESTLQARARSLARSLCNATRHRSQAVGETVFSNRFSIRKNIFRATASHASINYSSLTEQGLLPSVGSPGSSSRPQTPAHPNAPTCLRGGEGNGFTLWFLPCRYTIQSSPLVLTSSL